MTQLTTGATVKKLFAAFSVLACLMGLPGSAAAAPISGSFNLVGLDAVRVGASWIDWGPATASTAGCLPGANAPGCSIDGTTSTGNVAFLNPTSGDFVGIHLTPGTLMDLEDDFAPTGVAIDVDDFITMAARPAYDFTLTFIPVGVGTAAGCTSAPGAICTPPGSPFTIVNGAAGTGVGPSKVGSGVVFFVRGTVTDGSGDVSNWVGRFTTQLGISAAEALGLIATQGFIEASQSGNFDVTFSPIPEPATLLTFGAGTALIAAHRRRRAKKNQA